VIAFSLIAIKFPDTDFLKQIPTEWNKTKQKLTSTHCGPIFLLENAMLLQDFREGASRY